jgi:hypothetical protein
MVGASHVKHLKLLIALFAAVGLLEIGLTIEGESLLKRLFEIDVLEGVVYTAMFALPLLMAIWAVIRPPMLSWQSGVALTGFVVAVVRLKVWETLPELGSTDLHGIVRAAAAVLGTIASAIALMKPEAGATS